MGDRIYSKSAFFFVRDHPADLTAVDMWVPMKRTCPVYSLRPSFSSPTASPSRDAQGPAKIIILKYARHLRRIVTASMKSNQVTGTSPFIA